MNNKMKEKSKEEIFISTILVTTKAQSNADTDLL